MIDFDIARNFKNARCEIFPTVVQSNGSPIEEAQLGRVTLSCQICRDPPSLGCNETQTLCVSVESKNLPFYPVLLYFPNQ